jgi:hypothetical protein
MNGRSIFGERRHRKRQSVGRDLYREFFEAAEAKQMRRNIVDGIVYRSVRRREGECVAVFRPARVSQCRVPHHLQYRFEDSV